MNKKILVALGIFVSLLAACDNSWEAEEKAEQEKLANARQEKALYQKTVDSVLQAENYYVAKEDFYREIGKLYATRDSLRYLPSMADSLDRKVRKFADPVIKQGMRETVSALKPYNLNISVSEKIKNVGPFVNAYGSVAGDTVYGYYGHNQEVDFIVNIFCGDLGLEDMDESRAEKIRDIVRKHTETLLTRLKNNRVAISKTFSEYYPVLDLSQTPQQYRKYFNFDPAVNYPEDCHWYFRDNLGNGLMVTRTVRVYDSNLKPEFFNDSKSKYDLIQIAPGQWQVKKTLKSGKVEKTEVFFDNVEYEYTGVTSVIDGVKTGDKEFKAVSGTNVGMAIYSTEYVYVKRAAKRDALPGQNPKDFENLKKLEYKIWTQESQQQAREESLLHKADSIGSLRVKQFQEMLINKK